MIVRMHPTVTTMTTIKPVVVTEVRGRSAARVGFVGDRARGRWRHAQVHAGRTGRQRYPDRQGWATVRIAELQRGDKLTATIITNGPPAVLTEQEVQATLAESKAEPAKMESAKVEPTMTPVATAANGAQPAASAASSQPSAAPPASRPDERSGMGLTWYVAIAVLIADADRLDAPAQAAVKGLAQIAGGDETCGQDVSLETGNSPTKGVRK